MHIDILQMLHPIPPKYIKKSTICTKCNIQDNALNELQSDDGDDMDTLDEIKDMNDDDELNKNGDNMKNNADDMKNNADDIAMVVKRAVKKLVADTTARKTNG